MMKIKPIVSIFLLWFSLYGCAGNARLNNLNRNPDLVLFSPMGKEGEVLAQAVKSFEKQEGLVVKTITASEMDFTSQLWASLLSRSNQWDAVMVPTDMIPQMVDYHGLGPIKIPGLPPENSQKPADVGLSSVVRDVTVDGINYGLPIQYDVPVLIYRKDILGQQGINPPQDWQSLLSTIKTLKNISVKHVYVVAPGEGMGGYDFAVYLAGFGGSFLDNNGWVRMDDAQARQAFSYYVQIIRDPGLISPEAQKWGSAAAAGQLRSGDAVMGIVWLSDAASLMDCKQSPQACSDGKTKFGLSPIPGIVEQNGAVKRTYLRKEKAWVIAGNARHSHAAQAWLDWLASDEGRQSWQNAGGVPFNLWAGSPDGNGGARPDLALLVNALPGSVGMPAVVDLDEFWSPIHEMVSDAISGKKSSDQAMRDAAQEVRALLTIEGKVP